MSDATATAGPWRKSSRSGFPDDVECVEVADLTNGGAAVRDSKNPGGAVLSFGGPQWAAFIQGAGTDAFR